MGANDSSMEQLYHAHTAQSREVFKQIDELAKKYKAVSLNFSKSISPLIIYSQLLYYASVLLATDGLLLPCLPFCAFDIFQKIVFCWALYTE